MIYRRIKIGQSAQPIEIGLVEKPSIPFNFEDLFIGKQIRVIFMREEEEAILYIVETPKFLQIKPQDIRLFAYDHEKIVSLVSNCVVDNFSYYFSFNPLNENLVGSFQQELFVALQDLSSVLDLKTVNLTFSDTDSYSNIQVDVSFEYKNGESGTVSVNLDKENSL